jgi:hypothetical protein
MCYREGSTIQVDRACRVWKMVKLRGEDTQSNGHRHMSVGAWRDCVFAEMVGRSVSASGSSVMTLMCLCTVSASIPSDCVGGEVRLTSEQ